MAGQARVPDPRRCRRRLVDRRERFGEVAVLEKHVGELDARARSGRVESSSSSAVARRSRFAAAGRSPRANARRPAEASLSAARPPSSRPARVERPELRAVPDRLLEVVAEDLLELRLAVALAVDTLGPLDEPLVEVARARLRRLW